MNKYISDKWEKISPDETGAMLNDIALNGFLDDQYGSVQEEGIWIGLILEHKAIIQEDDQGFFDYKIFESEDEAQKKFTEIVETMEVSND